MNVRGSPFARTPQENQNMRSCFQTGALALGILALFASPSDCNAGDDAAQMWHKDYATAAAIAKQQKKPLFLVFR